MIISCFLVRFRIFIKTLQILYLICNMFHINQDQSFSVSSVFFFTLLRISLIISHAYDLLPQAVDLKNNKKTTVLSVVTLRLLLEILRHQQSSFVLQRSEDAQKTTDEALRRLHPKETTLQALTEVSKHLWFSVMIPQLCQGHVPAHSHRLLHPVR